MKFKGKSFIEIEREKEIRADERKKCREEFVLKNDVEKADMFDAGEKFAKKKLIQKIKDFEKKFYELKGKWLREISDPKRTTMSIHDWMEVEDNLNQLLKDLELSKS